MNRIFRRAPTVFALAFVASGVFGAEAGPDLSKLAAVPPCAGLVAAAQARHIPLEGIGPQGEAGRLDPGDSFAGLITLSQQRGRQTQWLLFVEALAPDPEAPAEKPHPPMVLYSGRGTRLEYDSAPARVRLLTLGPFDRAGDPSGGAQVKDKSVTFSLDKGYLGLGLERAAATILRTQKADVKGGVSFSSNPPGPAQAAEARKLAEAVHLSTEEERALGGLFPALFSYAEVIQHTEGLEDIMTKVIRKPTIWSVIGHFGVTANLMIDAKDIGLADLASWGMHSNSPAYHVPMWFKLNDRLALTATLLVTSPRPPLLSCGGIVGLLAEKPGDPETYLTLRVLSARCAKHE